MCGRYTLYETERLAETYSLDKNTQLDLLDNFNVAPGQYMPVIINDGKNNRLKKMRWGFIPHWARDPKIGYKLINAKMESVFDKPMWKQTVLTQRCLVPAHGFYEWQVIEDGKTKVPYFIYPKNTHIFSFAGLYSIWKDVEGVEIPSFTILTSEPNKEMMPIHNRMPVILTVEEAETWVNPGYNNQPDKIRQVLHPYPDNSLELYKVSSDVNSTRNNKRELIYSII